MLAFHNNPELKAAKLAQVRAHEAADEIVKGKYWEGGKGCAVGCTVHSSNHRAYETEMGIPQMLARLEDGIFEGLPNAEAKTFPARFIEAVPVGADLSLVGWQFLHWLVVDVTDRHGNEKTKAGVVDAIEILRRKAAGEEVSAVDARAAANTARAARAAAYAAYAAAYAAYAAAYAAYAAADDAADAAYADAADAADAAYAAAYAAYAAAYAAYAADADAADAAYAAADDAAADDAADAAYAAADDAADAAAYAAYAAAAYAADARVRQAEKLIELLAAAPIKAPEAVAA